MYFDGSQHDPSNLNNVFFGLLNCLAEKYPETSITIEHFLVNDRHVSHPLEDVRCICNNQQCLKDFTNIYRSHFYLIPLIPYPEFAHLKFEEYILDNN